MDENTKIFLDFWANYKWPEPNPIFYRLYYDDQGNPIVYSMEDLPGKYIEVTAEQYHINDYRLKVIDGKIVPVKIHAVDKLRPSDSGTPCHPRDVCIVVGPDTPHKFWK